MMILPANRESSQGNGTIGRCQVHPSHCPIRRWTQGI